MKKTLIALTLALLGCSSDIRLNKEFYCGSNESEKTIETKINVTYDDGLREKYTINYQCQKHSKDKVKEKYSEITF